MAHEFPEIRTVTCTYGGVGFVAHVDRYSHDEWVINEVVPDLTEDWPYHNGLYDLLDKLTIDSIEMQVAEAMAEPAGDPLDEYRAQMEDR